MKHTQEELNQNRMDYTSGRTQSKNVLLDPNLKHFRNNFLSLSYDTTALKRALTENDMANLQPELLAMGFKLDDINYAIKMEHSEVASIEDLLEFLLKTLIKPGDILDFINKYNDLKEENEKLKNAVKSPHLLAARDVNIKMRKAARLLTGKKEPNPNNLREWHVYNQGGILNTVLNTRLYEKDKQ
jgi:benzoyl-CoA reductase/2-hydroxyglutaryl-CoA dehydratase subunit BcrC/BadD/HgdB